MKKLILMMTAISLPAMAQDARPYHFSGPCTSQGVWTQSALNNTERLRQITRQLRDDANCEAASVSLQASLSAVEAEIQNAAANQGQAARLSQLPQELSALRMFMADAPANSSPKGSAMSLMMNKALELSMLQAKVRANTQITQNMSSEQISSVNTSLLSLGQRIHHSTNRGLRIFNDVIDSLPKVNECLISPNQTGPLLASTISVLSSFASSGQDSTGLQLAKAVEKLMGYAQREARFSEVMRNLNNAEYLASMACNMEVTSESYCSARDAQMLFVKNMNALEVKQANKENFELQGKINSGRAVTNPLAGYYVLTQHIPTITSWLQKIQIGVTPNLKTDADFQKSVLDLVNDFFKKVKDLEANYNQKIRILKGMQKLEEKQSFVLDLLISTVGIFLSDNQLGGSADVNFFKMAVGQPRELAFRLLDMEVPIQVRGNGEGAQGYLQSPEEYLQNNYRRLPQFQNPDALAEAIGKKLFDEYIVAAKNRAVDYYNQFSIVDKVGLVNSSLIGMNYNVRDSFIAVNQYLEGLEARLAKQGNNHEILPSIIETRARIKKILARYESLRTLGQNLSQANLNETEKMSRIVEANVNLIKEVYEQLDVLLARTGWLANRMVDYVYKDYTSMIHARTDLSPYYEELFYATGLASIKQMVDMAGSNPANVQQDLAMALRLNKENIDSLERLVSDSLAAQVGRLHVITTNNRITPGALMYESMSRSYRDGYEQNPGDDHSKIYRTFRGTINHLGSMLFGMDGDRYNIPGPMTQIWEPVKSLFGNGTQIASGDDEFGSAKRVKAQLCTQALAFKDLRPFWLRCKGEELTSPYALPEMNEERAKIDDYLSANFSKIAWKDVNNRPLNHSNRICAFRDFNRRNLVLWLTQGMRKN